MKNRLLSYGIFVLLMFGGAFWYLSPGSEALVQGRTDLVMGDGTDSASLPYGYELLRHTFETKPSRLFYGAVYTEVGTPEKGQSLWIPWNERWLSVFLTYLFPFEQISTAFIFLLLVLNGVMMFLLCEYLKWNRWVSMALAFSWAFNVYTRARAKVHGALVGTYHIPLIFLALYLVVRGKSHRSLAAAAAALLVAGTVAHYYLVTCVFLSPLFIAFVVIQPEFKADWKRISRRFAIAALPLILFLGSSYVFMLPPEATLTKPEAVAEEVMPDGSAHPFLKVFHAFPIDYLAGDLGLVGRNDWNVLREKVNDEVLSDLGYSNPHERSNGIRWSVIALALLCFFFFARGRFRNDVVTTRNLIFLSIFGFFVFWLSLAPDVPFDGFSPSFWLYKFFPKIRVSSRAGIMVHFTMLMMIGFLSTLDWKWKKILVYPGVLLAIVFVDYPPVNAMPMAPVFPAYGSLHRDNGACETGMVFPFINPLSTQVAYYFFTQRIRGSDCTPYNATPRRDEVVRMLNTFPPTPEFLQTLSQRPDVADKVEQVARCTPLNWIVFLQPTPVDWANSVCRRLGWKMDKDLVCLAPARDKKMQKLMGQCL